MKYKLVIFDMEGTVTHEDSALPWTEKMLSDISYTKKALVSDLPIPKVKEKLIGAGIDPDAFDDIMSSLHYSEAFEGAASKSGVKHEETVVCTSSIVAVKLANRLGMKCVAVQTHFKEEMYKKAGADLVVKELSSLSDILA